MVQFSFPTSVFEHFELQVARNDTDNVSLCPKGSESTTTGQSSVHELGNGFIHISSCQKNGQEVWIVSLTGLPVATPSIQSEESTHQSTTNHCMSEPNSNDVGSSFYPQEYAASPDAAIDWAPWKVSDFQALQGMTEPTSPIDVRPSRLSSPNASLSSLQQLSEALHQQSIDNSQFPMNGYPGLEIRDCHFAAPSQQYRDTLPHSGISSPSNQSSLSDSGSEDEDHHHPSSLASNVFPCVDLACKKIFKRAHARNNHVKRRHPTIPNNSVTPIAIPSRVVHQCSLRECGEQFTRRHDRMRHEWSQHGMRSDFACSHCPRLFSSQNRLDRHYAEKHPTICR